MISVIIPTFNRPAYLREAVTSMARQSFDDFELLIVDDSSTDETPAVITELCRHDRRIVGLRTKSNGGCNSARNLGLDRAQGDVIAFLDDDDLALPDRLKEGMAALEAQPSAGFAYCTYRFIDAAGSERPDAPADVDIGDHESNSDRLFETLYCNWTWLPTSTLMFRSSALRGHRYPEIRRSDGDSIFLTQLAAMGACCTRVPEVGALMRRDASYPTMSRDRRQLLAARRETLKFLRRWLRDQRITRFDHLHTSAWANHLIKEAQYLGGGRGLARALEGLARDPGNQAAWGYFRESIGRRLRR